MLTQLLTAGAAICVASFQLAEVSKCFYAINNYDSHQNAADAAYDDDGDAITIFNFLYQTTKLTH
jgi:hypothetical protein